MIGLIRRRIFRHKMEARIEADKRFQDLVQQAARDLTQLYGFRGSTYNVLSQVEFLCDELDRRDYV